MTTKNDEKFVRGIDLSFQNVHEEFDEFWPEKYSKKSQKFQLSWDFFDQSICLSLKGTEELCLMALNIDAKFEGKLTCAFKNDMKNLANFVHRLKNSHFILESKMAKLNQNKN